MQSTLKKWGNSAAIRIPTSVLKATHLELEDAVEVREETGRIVIEPVRPKTYNLNELVDAITPKNQHASIDFGEPEGKEIW